ncbi:peptidyl-tRNA hydrolase, partial [Globomyces pollinis-pini]
MYAKNRHNVGMMALDFIVKQYGLKWTFHKPVKGYISETIIESTSLIFFKPKEFMNLNGKPIGKAVRHFNVTPSNLIVIHDDLERSLGKISWKQGGSANGHNGIRSIISHLNTNEFERIRIGIDRPEDKNRVPDYVLENFNELEFSNLETNVLPLFQQSLSDLIVKRNKEM